MYICPICGNVIDLLNGKIEHIKCCNTSMMLLEANVLDASLEKHVPFCQKINDQIIIKVGEVMHPMEENHYIMWLLLVGDNKTTKIDFKPNMEPIVTMYNDNYHTVYAYCNNHGLWKTSI